MHMSSRFGRSAAIVAAAASLTIVAQGAAVPGSRVQAASGCPLRQGPVGAAFQDCSQGHVFNVVPPGQTGTYDATDYANAQASPPTFPPNTRNQEPLYANLVKIAPNLGAGLIRNYYKDASFATDTSLAGDRVETFSSHPNAVVFRYSQFGVPHVYGVTRSDTEFGAGYASAEDRLFEMDVLRHVGRAQLSSFVGPSPSNEAMDCSVASAAGYSEAELQSQVDKFASLHTDPITIGGVKTTEGQQIVDDATAFIAGVNQYVSDAVTHQNGAKLPAEYGLLQIAPPGQAPLPGQAANAAWKATDVVATATLVQAIFATGGGNEVASALFYQSLVQRYGAIKGAAIWSDLRSQNDPGAQVSIPTTFNYEHVPTGANFDPHSLAMPLGAPTNTFTVASDGSTHCTIKPLAGAAQSASATRTGPAGVTVDLSPLLTAMQHRTNPAASNELIVDAAHSATGHPVAVFGPQTGYFAPQLLHEIDLHGPGLHARGVSFAGTEVFVELGHGVDYAWSATSAGSDIVDQRLEKLCNLDGSTPTTSSTAYIYNGTCTAMFERTDAQTAKSSPGALCPTPMNPNNPCPPATVTIQIERTVHGPVIGRTTALDPNTGKTIPVAVSSQRSTYGDELGSSPAFLEWNDPDIIHNALDFQRAAGKETGTFNWTYVDSKNVGYYSSGQLPVRNPHVNPNFPVWGTGQWEWQGFVPINLSASDVHPRANTMPATPGVVNGSLSGGFFTNWNNKQSPGFSASDSQYSYGPVYRVQSLADRVRAIISKRKATPVDIINAMEDAGTVDLDGAQLVNQMAGVLNGATLTQPQKNALSILQTWTADPFWGSGVPGAHRRDRSGAGVITSEPGSGSYEQGNAAAIMDELYQQLIHVVFDPWLNSSQFGQLLGLNFDTDRPREQGSAYDGGWEGYLQRSFLQAVGHDPHPYSQSYCGNGSVAACQSALRNALQATIDAMTAKYGSSDPTKWTCSRSNPTGGRGVGSGQTVGVQCNPSFDDIKSSDVGVGDVPPMAWINRPTFQQVVQFTDSR